MINGEIVEINNARSTQTWNERNGLDDGLDHSDYTTKGKSNYQSDPLPSRFPVNRTLLPSKQSISRPKSRRPPS